MGDTHSEDAQNAHGLRVWELGRTCIGRSQSQRHMWMSSNDMSVHRSPSVCTGGEYRTGSHKVYMGGSGKVSWVSCLVIQWVGRVEEMRNHIYKGLELWGSEQDLGQLKAIQAKYRGMVDEATMVVFRGMDKDFILQAVVKRWRGL